MVTVRSSVTSEISRTTPNVEASIPSREWRETLLKCCGPGVLAGITFENWARLLRDRALSLDASRFPRLVSLTVQSLKNSLLASSDRRRYGPLVEQTKVLPPLFVLGHWRSGTTYLHELLACDPQFGFPNSYQVCFPHSFLTAEATDARVLSLFMPRSRPMDNMALTLASPQEDEFALCVSTLQSPCMAWVFPRHKQRFEKYLTFRSVQPAERATWTQAFVHFLKKVQFRVGNRPLLLKSPPHTARIRLLLELFPEAKFVHIHRDPCRVYQSTRRAFRIIYDWHGLQRPCFEDLDDWILRQYRQMYDAFFEEKSLIPVRSFHEVCFEELERDPIGQTARLYDALGLPGFQVAEARLRRYVESVASYKKNGFPEPEPYLKARLRLAWHRTFEEWGY